MLAREKLQQILFFLIFINCCIVITFTSISLSSDNWVLVRPYRKLESTPSLIFKQNPLSNKVNESQIIKNQNDTFKNNTLKEKYDYMIDIEDNFLNDEDESDEDLLPIDLYAQKDCKRHNGRIKFGLFKGVWVLNYAFGCKNRINRVSIIELLSKYRIFDQTLWISTILCCFLALFSTFISALFSLFNAFVSSNRVMKGPISMYLWNSIAAFFHLLAIFLFMIEYHFYIKKNVLTKDELESGWTSANRAQLNWTFYILVISILLILVNILIIYVIVRFKKYFILNIKNIYETNMNLITGNNGLLNNYNINENKPNYEHIAEVASMNIVAEENGSKSQNESNNIRNDEKKTSIKLKRLIDFIY